MEIEFKSQKPLLLLLAVGALILSLVVAFGLMSIRQIEQLDVIAEKFYAHPFTVSNASTELISNLSQMRIQILLVSRAQSHEQIHEMVDEIAVLNAQNNKLLAIFKDRFLGEMKKVRELEQLLIDWDSLRSEIIAHAYQGNNEKVKELVLKDSAIIYHRALEKAEYIHGFAHDKAVSFEQTARVESRFMINNLYWIMGILISLVIASLGYLLQFFYNHNRQLEIDASTDTLTGLLNRQQLSCIAHNAIERVKRYDGHLAALMVDIDHFKQINDQHGHNAGDEVLKALSQMLLSILRNSDIICRWGGEEFVVLMPEINLEEACHIAERIRKRAEEEAVYAADSRIGFSVSIGVTSYQGQLTIEELLHEADKALYIAKTEGRNKVIRYQSNWGLLTLSPLSVTRHSFGITKPPPSRLNWHHLEQQRQHLTRDNRP